jgi:hypothetical protein
MEVNVILKLFHSRSLSKDMHGAPPGGFTHRLAVVIGSISSVHKMAFFWQSVVLEVSIMQINRQLGNYVVISSILAVPFSNTAL